MNRLLGNFRDQRVSQSLSQDEQFNIDSFCLIRNHQDSNFQWEVSINKVISRPRLLRRGHAFSLFFLLLTGNRGQWDLGDWKSHNVAEAWVPESPCGGKPFTNQEDCYMNKKQTFTVLNHWNSGGFFYYSLYHYLYVLWIRMCFTHSSQMDIFAVLQNQEEGMFQLYLISCSH